MSKKENLPKVLWAARVNMAGLWSSKPIKVRLDEEMLEQDFDAVWYDKEGDFGVDVVGLEKNEYSTTLSSTSKDEIKQFIAGAEAVLSVLRSFSAKEED